MEELHPSTLLRRVVRAPLKNASVALGPATIGGEYRLRIFCCSSGRLGASPRRSFLGLLRLPPKTAPVGALEKFFRVLDRSSYAGRWAEADSARRDVGPGDPAGYPEEALRRSGAAAHGAVSCEPGGRSAPLRCFKAGEAYR